MSSLWAVIRTEMWLTWRRYTFWVVQAIWLLPLALTFVSNLPNARTLAGAPFVGEQLVTFLTTWLLLLPLIVGPALTRDLGEAGEILWTTPLDALVHLLGVALGLLLALLPALLAQLAFQWLVGYALVGWPAILFWRYGPPLFLASTVAGVGVAIVLALLLRRTLLLLLVWLAVWAGVMQASMGFFGALESSALASPANVFFYNLQLSPTLGVGLARPLLQGLVVWLVGLGALASLLGVGAALLADRRRLVRPGPSLATWIVVATLLAGGGWLLHARAVRAQAILASPADIQPASWQVEAHDLDVSVDAERNTLTGTSTLRLVPVRPLEEAKLVLRLNPGMVVTEARDEAGQLLIWERVGDSVVVALPSPAAEPLTLQLQWQGTPRLPYNDYAAHTGNHYPAFDTPQPVRALLSDGVGYLFRDGDWYPWPWGNGPGPQQAETGRVTLRVSGSEPLASAPLQDGVVGWGGELPTVLLVLPPASTKTVNGRTLHVGPWVGPGSTLMTRLEQIAELAPRFTAMVGAEPAPRHIVALPYLNDLVWSGDLLLVPEGTGSLSDDTRRLLLSPSIAGETGAGVEERAVMTALARAWLANHMALPSGWVRVRPDREGVVALAGVPGQVGVVRLPGVADDPEARWIRVPGSRTDLLPSTGGKQQQPRVGGGQDLRTMVKTSLVPEDHLNLLALWLAVESADPAVREADLAVLLAPPDPTPSSAKFEPFLMRSLPFDFPVGQAQKAALVAALHKWLEEVGREQALQLVGETVRNQASKFDLARLLEALEQRSGVAIEYEESE